MLERAPRIVAGCLMMLFCQLPAAQSYPAKTVRIIVPVGAGGATDILSRTLGQRLAPLWGQQVVVDNRPGGGSNIGFEVAAKGAAASVTDLMGGHVALAFVSLSSVVPQLKAGRLRALGITSAKRSALMPDLPTFAEAGVGGIEATGWYGVVVPAGTPREIIDRLHADITKTLAQPEVAQSLNASGLEPAAPNSPEAFTEFLRAEIIKWAKVVKASGAKAD